MASAVNKILLPFLEAEGFILEELPGERLRRWKQGAAFVLRDGPGELVVRTAPAKFGRQLGLNVAKSPDRSHYQWMPWHEHGLSLADLRYSDQDELEAALRRIVDFLRTHGLTWLREQP